jgi:hypothetical protein
MSSTVRGISSAVRGIDSSSRRSRDSAKMTTAVGGGVMHAWLIRDDDA